MITTKQIIKTNQILSVGWSLSIGKIWENLWTNQQPSLEWYIKYTMKSENKINIVRVLFLLSMPKKVKEVLRTSLSGNKITWTETFVRSKKFAKSKATLNWGTLACYEDLPIKPTLKNVQSFLCVTVISQFSSLHCLSSITHKILITDTCYGLELITVILGFSENIHFWRNNHSFQNYNFFLKVQGSNFQV